VQLDRILAEGMEARLARHQRLQERRRSGPPPRLPICSAEGARSESRVSCFFRPPASIAGDRQGCTERGYTIGSGLRDWKPATFRIGHMGEVRESDLDACWRDRPDSGEGDRSGGPLRREDEHAEILIADTLDPSGLALFARPGVRSTSSRRTNARAFPRSSPTTTALFVPQLHQATADLLAPAKKLKVVGVPASASPMWTWRRRDPSSAPGGQRAHGQPDIGH